jgi:hypothetical protein
MKSAEPPMGLPIESLLAPSNAPEEIFMDSGVQGGSFAKDTKFG